MSDDRPMTRPPRKIQGIENREHRRRDGTVYWTFRVRWIDPATGRRVAETFPAQRDAIDFRSALRLARRSGALADLNAGRETLAEYAEHWWATYAATNLSVATLKAYSVQWNRHALPRIGQLQLRAVTPGVLARFRDDLQSSGVGIPTIRKTMGLVQAILRRAVEEDRIRSNPSLEVRKPSQPRQRAVHPVAPPVIEQLRDGVSILDATLITVMGYAGLRPEEALALQWRHIRKATILVEQKNVNGEVLLGQKVDGKPPRTVDMLQAVRHDLAAYRLAAGRPGDDAYVFPNNVGDPWSASLYRAWRAWTWQPLAADVGIATLDRVTKSVRVDGQIKRRRKSKYVGARPYDLRHSFASLLIHEGRLSVIEIAQQLGHSTETLLSTYAHIFAELRDQPKVPADEQIATARAAIARRNA